MVEQRTHKPLVVSSNLTAATRVGLLPDSLEELSVRELLMMLLGEDMRRKLMLRQLTNQNLFALYDSEIVCRHRSAKGLYEDRRILKHFAEFLGQYPPSPELGKSFLAKFAHRKTATLARYVAVLKPFFDWYGEKLNMKVRLPRQLPPYTEEADINALIKAIEGKATHKGIAGRDCLLIHLAVNTGLRRTELANLKVGDIHLEQGYLSIKAGKGEKDGIIPLNDTIATLLRPYIKNMKPEQSLFGIKPTTISGKFERFSKKAGVDLHCHSLRHHFGTQLVEKGANPEAVRQLMRHSRMDTTQRYLSLADKGLREAIELLDKEKAEEPWGYDPLHPGRKLPRTY